MIARGQLVPQIIRQGSPDPRKGEPPGTKSQLIRYVDRAGQSVVLVHQYLRPNGTLGASGRPDPKRLRLGKVLYISKK